MKSKKPGKMSKDIKLSVWLKAYWGWLVLGLLIVWGFFLRLHNLADNYSLWMDEDHVALMVRSIYENGLSDAVGQGGGGIYQIGLYLFGVLSTSLFGLSEMALRLPAVLFGAFTPVVIYLFANYVFNRKTALLSAFLATFLQIEILWSRQARPYQMLQLFYLLTGYFIYRYLTEKKNRFFWFFFISGITASLFHGLGLVVLGVGISIIILSNFRRLWYLAVIAVVSLVPLYFLFGLYFSSSLVSIGKQNNYYYYRVFLTHNYLSLTLFALSGGLSLLLQKQWRKIFILAAFSLPQLFIISFVLPQPFVRYFYIIFGFIVTLAAYGAFQIPYLISKIKNQNSKPYNPHCVIRISQLIVLVVLFLPLIVQNKLTLFPKPYYSLNADMQEIPEVDWKAVYQVVKNHQGGTAEVPLVTNWGTTPQWYLGDAVNLIFTRNDGVPNRIASADQLADLIHNTQRGIVVLDSWDNYIPADVLSYCQDNLRLLYKTDRLYPTQPRYWPVSVYSWGI